MVVYFLIALMVLAVVMVTPVLMIITYFRARRVDELARRVARLETHVGRLLQGLPAAASPPPVVEKPAVPSATAPPTPAAPIPAPAPIAATPVARPAPQVVAPEAAPSESFQWEMFIGQRALGWTAAVVLVFATAFFLRYAFENNWIGPIGRVSLGVLGGVVLVAGGRSAFRRDWRIYAQILTGAGVALLYLSTYSAVGFYHLLPQDSAFVFLLILVVEAALLSLAYDSAALALMSIVGGLLTPLLMSTPHDQYATFFSYLALLNVGAAVMTSRRRWPAVGLVTLLGVQLLFWLWYAQNYHPEKLAAALAFQGVVFATCLGQSASAQLLRGHRLGWEDAARMVVNAALAFTAFYVLLRPDYRPWLGTLAIGMAIVHALLGRAALRAAKSQRRPDTRLVLTALAIASAFVALAIPLEARADWVALGWIVEAALLLWFGYRVQSPALRAMALPTAALAAGRLVFLDTWRHMQLDAPVAPLINDYALPALAVCAVWLGALLTLRPFRARIADAERALLGMALVAGLALVGYVLSIDWLAFCKGQELYRGADVEFWRWTAQTGLSVVWGLYATALLIVGFAIRNSIVRWTALVLYAATIAKVFLFDLSELDELYRILSFFALALLLGFAAWAYQRMRHVLAAPGEP